MSQGDFPAWKPSRFLARGFRFMLGSKQLFVSGGILSCNTTVGGEDFVSAFGINVKGYFLGPDTGGILLEEVTDLCSACLCWRWQWHLALKSVAPHCEKQIEALECIQTRTMKL